MSLQVWLPLNGNTDNLGLAGNCVVKNTLTYTSGGKFGESCRNGGKLSIDKNYVGLYGSIAFWVYVDENTDYSPNVVFGNDSTLAGTGNRKWTLHLYPNRNSLHSWGLQDDSSSSASVGSFTISNIIPDGVWTHICVTHAKNGKQTVYANGEQVFSNTANISGTYTFDVETNICYDNNSIKIQDFRIYDHTLSKEEVKEISKGLILHYNFEDVVVSLNNEKYNQSIQIYNNYNGTAISNIITASLSRTGESFEGSPIWRLVMKTSDSVALANLQTTLFNHGICWYGTAFNNNQPLVYGILWRPVSHSDTEVGGMALNRYGAYSFQTNTENYKNNWTRFNGCRMNISGTDGSDGIYISVKCPSLQLDEELIIEFCQPEVYRGIDYVPVRNRYTENAENIIYDSSGYGYNGIKNGNLLFSKDSVEGEYSLDARGEDFVSYVRCVNAPQLKKGFTWNLWVKQNDKTTPKTIQMPMSQGRDYLCYGMNIVINNGKVSVLAGGNSEGNYQYNIGTNTTLDDNWHMITSVVDNDGHIFNYIDGNEEGRYIGDNTITCEYEQATGGLLIGKMSYSYNSNTSYFPFNGLIDDVRIYGTALSANDIKSLYEVKCYIDKNGNIKSGNFEEQNVGDELLTTQKLVLGQNVSYTTEASIEYNTNGTQVINKITFGETNTSWKILTSTSFNKNIILGKKLLWSFSWKTDSQFDKLLTVEFRQSNGQNLITMVPQISYNQGNWVRYTGIMVMGDTYIGNQGLYIAVGNGKYTNNTLYIKDLSLKIIDDTEDDKLVEITKKYQIITNEIIELQTEKAMINKYSRLIANEIIEI